MNTLPYEEWPTDEYARRFAVEDIFGRHLSAQVDRALGGDLKRYAPLCPSAPTEEVRQVARKAMLDGIYAVMMLLDGVASSEIDESHVIGYALTCQILERTSIDGKTKNECVETIELGPESDGLCGSFHGWFEP
jgi:hypothetical protein